MAIAFSNSPAYWMANFADRSRRGRPMKVNGIVVPDRVEVKGRSLIWSRPKYHEVYPSDRLLLSFVKLADEISPKAFLKFAQRYGVFGAIRLFRKDLPRDTDIRLGFQRWRVSVDRDYTNYSPLALMREPIALWRRLSKNARAILQVAAELKNHRRVARREDWRDMYFEPPKYIDYPVSTWDAWWRLIVFVNHWVQVGRVRLALQPKYDPRRKNPFRFNALEINIECDGEYNLFGALATQIMLAVAGKDKLATCSSCYFPYFPVRQPKAAQNSYCQDCRDLGRPQYDADRRRKEKMIKARSLAKKGVRVAKIAADLEITKETAGRWIARKPSSTQQSKRRY